MPSKVDKFTVGEEYDRRRKLTDEQRDEIIRKYATGEYSYNKLAKEYNVSKKLIMLIINPESKKRNDERIKAHWKDYVGTKEERAKIAREHRAYKKQLLDEGKIGNKE